MKKKPLRVLNVEDNEDDLLLILRELRQAGYEPECLRVETPEDMSAALDERTWDIVISDYKMPQFSGPDALKLLQEKDLDLPFIMVSGTVGENVAVEAMKAGAHDYLMKGSLIRLGPAVERELREAAMRRDRRRAMDALRESEEKWRSIAENTPDHIMLLDRDAKIQFINRTVPDLTKEEVVGKPVYDFTSPEFSEIAAKCVLHVLETGEPKMYETEYRSKEGEVQYFEVRLGPVFRSGEIVGLVSSSSNVTERKQMRIRLAQADRMASVGTLAAGVAHEINNPLAYVLYNLQSLSEDLPKVTGALSQAWSTMVGQLGADQAAEMLGAARELCEQGQLDDLVSRAEEAADGAVRIRDIVRDLRTFSKVEEDRRAPVHLYQVIETALNMVYNEIKYRARIVKDYGSTPPVLASEGRLSQVLLNLLVNAAHAIDEGDVEHNEIRIRTWTEGDEVCVEVRDTGRGIQKEHLDRLFDPFFTTKPIGVGSGLGLSICHNIVSSYGGRIEVDSRAGEGTRFTVCLPRLEAKDVPEYKEPEKEELELPLVRGRILVVDDEPMIGSTIKRILRREHEVVLAESGAGGKKILSKDTGFDLILCDLMMPDVSGMDLYDWVQKEHPDMIRRMVFITGGAFTPRAAQFIQRVDNLRMEKPFDPKNLRTLIRDLLNPPGTASR